MREPILPPPPKPNRPSANYAESNEITRIDCERMNMLDKCKSVGYTIGVIKTHPHFAERAFGAMDALTDSLMAAGYMVGMRAIPPQREDA